MAVAMGGLVAIAAIALPVILIIRRRAARGAKSDASSIERERLIKEREVNTLQRRLESAALAIRKAVLEKGMLPELRAIINTHLRPRYDTVLNVPVPPGLAEVFNPEYEIGTEPKDRLRRLLSSMPGGSIGLAGPRGAGKTTLLRAFCSKESIKELKKRPVLSVLILAPVEYDTREFILHIFSSVCLRVLELKGKAHQSPWDDVRDVRIRPASLLAGFVGLREALGLVGVGAVLVITSIYLPISALGIPRGLVSGMGLIMAVLGLLGLLAQVLHTRRQPQREDQQESGDEDLLVRIAHDQLREIRFQQSYSSGWAGTLSFPIAQAAADVRTDAAVSLARHQLSLPEIMDLYRDFIEEAKKEYEIIVGIDELDKIGSDEKAQQFLNEIKALFGLESCFYLVSVSESALSNFERRGLPVRDVFDSSFDVIVYVDYLDLKRAQELLRRRAIGVPIPFLYFCYCLTGGLPRDLIRAFRNLFEEREQSEQGEEALEALCGSMIRSDLKAKSRAASIEMRETLVDPDVDQILGSIREFQSWLEPPDRPPLTYEELLDQYHRLVDAANALELAAQTRPADAAAQYERIKALATDLAIYIYFCATLLEFFKSQLDHRKSLKEAETSGALDQLSEARQAFTISPGLAESAIMDFRDSYSMSSS